jgi:hypothetical protein
MKADTRRVLDKARKAAKEDPVPLPSGELILPTKTEMAEAKKRKAEAEAEGQDTLPPCHVIGLDYEAYASAIVDLDGSADKVASARRAYARKGYTMLRGQPVVVGFSHAEVWVKDRSEWLADREARKASIFANVQRGVMSDSVVAPAHLKGAGPQRS